MRPTIARFSVCAKSLLQSSSIARRNEQHDRSILTFWRQSSGERARWIEGLKRVLWRVVEVEANLNDAAFRKLRRIAKDEWCCEIHAEITVSCDWCSAAIGGNDFDCKPAKKDPALRHDAHEIKLLRDLDVRDAIHAFACRDGKRHNARCECFHRSRIARLRGEYFDRGLYGDFATDWLDGGFDDEVARRQFEGKSCRKHELRRRSRECTE